jgi:hypothetical protein
MGSGVAMHYACHTGVSGLHDHGAGVIFRIARVHHHRAPHFACERELLRECPALLDPG